MRIALYKQETPLTWTRLRDVTLAGKSGPFAARVRHTLPAPSGAAEWTLSESEILKSLGIAGQEHALILDLRPSDKSRVQLARIRSVRGISFDDSTTLLLDMEICRDEESENVSETRDAFDAPAPSSMEAVYALVQMKGGMQEQKWTWESGPRSNVPVFNREAMQFLARSVYRESGDNDSWPVKESSKDDYATIAEGLDELLGSAPRPIRPLQHVQPAILAAPMSPPAMPPEPAVPTPPAGDSIAHRVLFTARTAIQRLFALFGQHLLKNP